MSNRRLKAYMKSKQLFRVADEKLEQLKKEEHDLMKQIHEAQETFERLVEQREKDENLLKDALLLESDGYARLRQLREKMKAADAEAKRAEEEFEERGRDIDEQDQCWIKVKSVKQARAALSFTRDFESEWAIRVSKTVGEPEAQKINDFLATHLFGTAGDTFYTDYITDEEAEDEDENEDEDDADSTEDED